MYKTGSGIHAYKQTNVSTAEPKQLVLMCYDGAITHLQIAKEKYIAKEYEAKATALQKVLDILDLLMSSLDFEAGGKIAENLEALYNYMTRRLLEDDVKKDLAAVDESIRMLEELRSAWKQIFSVPKAPYHESFHPQGDMEEISDIRRVTGAY